MLTIVTSSPWHLRSPASHSVIVWLVTFSLPSMQMLIPPSSHCPSSRQMHLLVCSKKQNKKTKMHVKQYLTLWQKNRLRSIYQNCANNWASCRCSRFWLEVKLINTQVQWENYKCNQIALLCKGNPKHVLELLLGWEVGGFFSDSLLWMPQSIALFSMFTSIVWKLQEKVGKKRTLETNSFRQAWDFVGNNLLHLML